MICIVIAIPSLTACKQTKSNPVMTIKFAGGSAGIEGTVKIELYPDKAPNTVSNIISLINMKYYDGINVSKVLQNSYVEIADLKNIQLGTGLDYAIEGECTANGFEGNDIPFVRGTVAMKKYDKNDYDSATDGFFVVLKDTPEFDGEYAAFGTVISGIEILDEISNVKGAPAFDYEPVYNIKVETIEIRLFGQSYDKVRTIVRKYY